MGSYNSAILGFIFPFDLLSGVWTPSNLLKALLGLKLSVLSYSFNTSEYLFEPHLSYAIAKRSRYVDERASSEWSLVNGVRTRPEF